MTSIINLPACYNLRNGLNEIHLYIDDEYHSTWYSVTQAQQAAREHYAQQGE